MLDCLLYVSCFSVLRSSFLVALTVGSCLNAFAGGTQLLAVYCCDFCGQVGIFVGGCVLVSAC